GGSGRGRGPAPFRPRATGRRLAAGSPGWCYPSNGPERRRGGAPDGKTTGGAAVTDAERSASWGWACSLFPIRSSLRVIVPGGSEARKLLYRRPRRRGHPPGPPSGRKTGVGNPRCGRMMMQKMRTGSVRGVRGESMRAVLQRVSRARVRVGDEVTGEIGRGLLVLLGVARTDTPEQARWLAEKVVALRIFEDDEGKMN